MKIALTGGDYQSRSFLASTQRCVNLYQEAIEPQQGEPYQYAHLLTPGLTLLATSPTNEAIRGMYRASNGNLYVVSGFNLYFIEKTWSFHLLGKLLVNTGKPVIMSDNGTSLVVCDGTTNGYTLVIATNTGFAPLPVGGTYDVSGFATTNGWLGSNFFDFTDTFIIANQPGTPLFYISDSEAITFDALNVAGKSAKPDILLAAIVSHRVIWLIGNTSSEVWYNSGGGGLGTTSTGIQVNTFPFEIMPGVSIEDGCCAQYSIAKADTKVFWLAQNVNGSRYLLLGSGYQTQRVSNHAVENIWHSYSRVDDAIAYCYMQDGHHFYVLNFPTADATWVYDLSSKLWHQRTSIDNDGVEHRHRGCYSAFAYDTNVVGDWENGNIYSFDLNNFTDNGGPIKRLRTFPHQMDPNSNHRVIYRSFVADIESGDNIDSTDLSLVSLRWSTDRGKSWSNAMKQSLGKTGQYITNLKWNRIGMARDMVFELSWSVPAQTALTAAFIDVEVASS